MKKRLFLLILVFLCSSAAYGQKDEQKPLQPSKFTQLSKNILMGSALGIISGNAWADCDTHFEGASPSTKYMSSYIIIELPLKGFSHHMGVASNAAYCVSYFASSMVTYYLNTCADDGPLS